MCACLRACVLNSVALHERWGLTRLVKVLSLARSWDMRVEERYVNMAEVHVLEE